MSHPLPAQDEAYARLFLWEGDAGWERSETVLDVLRAAQTVTGIAKMAGVTRRTVQRRGIAAGTFRAVEFIAETRARRACLHFTERGFNPRAMPLVYLPNTRPPIMLRGRNVITLIRDMAESRDAESKDRAVLVDRSGATRKHFQRSAGASKRYRAPGGKIVAIPAGSRDATPAELRRRVFHDLKGGRIAANRLCLLLGVSRSGFYKWLKGLTQYQRDLVKQQLKHPHLPPVGGPA